jgi:flagellar motor switch protein FliN/FliY
MTTNQPVEANQQTFSSEFFNALAAAMSEAGGSPWLIAAVPDAEAAQDGTEPVRFNVALDGGLKGEFLLEFERPEAAKIATTVLRQDSEEFGPEHSEALMGLVKAGAERFKAALAAEHGSVSVAASLDSRPIPSSAQVLQFTAGDDKNNRVSMRMHLSSELATALTVQTHNEKASDALDKAKKVSAGMTNANGVNLEMVMDVELNVTLRFGQRQLTLREVLDLTSGSVVELDRQVDEPVELLLDGVLIAKGEAVVVDGNYGLRVTEVSQPVSASVLARR